MKKRLLVYLSVIIGCLFIGFTVVHLLTNHEVISATGPDTFYLNINESDKIDMSHVNPSKDTKVEHTVSQEGIISFDEETGVITALSGGNVKLTISTTNENYGPFEFEIFVGDGKDQTTPFYIKTAEDLQAIGGTRTYEDESHDWSLKAFYQMMNDIDLSGIEWKPIGNLVDDPESTENKPFAGQFFGDRFYIRNLTISEDTISAGLFAYISDNALVEAVKFDKASIKGAFEYAGVVAGYSEGAIITQVEITNSEILLSPNTIVDEGLLFAYSAAGGIVGRTEAFYWEDEDSQNGYAYQRSTITMCSFDGIIDLDDDFIEVCEESNIEKITLSLGGIAGYNTGAAILNNRAEIAFNISKNLLTALSEKGFNPNVGGIVGLLDARTINEGESIFIQPLVKNNLSLITMDNPSTRTGGVTGVVTEEAQDGGQCIWGNYFYSPQGNINDDGASSSIDAVKQIKNTKELKSQETYKTADFEDWDMGKTLSVWLMKEKNEIVSPHINFESGMPQEIVYHEGVYEISTAVEFELYYKKMTDSTTTYMELQSKKFWLSQNYILKADINLADIEISEFTPIGYNDTFIGTFDGNGYKLFYNNDKSNTMLLKNTKIEDSYKYSAMGLFYIVKGTVKNLTLENFTVDFGKYAGVLAGVNAGNIVDCYLLNPCVENGVSYGLIVGTNTGSIMNTITDYDYEAEEDDEGIPYSIKLTGGKQSLGVVNSSNNIYVGGVAGFNTGIISNIKISGDLIITAEKSTHNVTRTIGGVVGYNSGKIEKTSISKAYISDYSLSKVHIGGFCGFNNGEISQSYTGELLESPTTISTSTSLGDQVAGGFAGAIGYKGKVIQSFANASVEGFYIAGFTPTLFGEVSECYVKGDLKGEYVGGFAATLSHMENSEQGGIISNCYSVLKISGISDTSVTAGISLLLKEPAKVENSFFSNTFIGKGKQFLETCTDTRSKAYQFLIAWFEPNLANGTVNNIIIDREAEGNNSKEVIESGKYFRDKSQVAYYISHSQAKDALELFTQSKFNVGATGIWRIEVGELPMLANLDLDGITQTAPEQAPEEVEEDKEGEEESP